MVWKYWSVVASCLLATSCGTSVVPVTVTSAPEGGGNVVTTQPTSSTATTQPAGGAQNDPQGNTVVIAAPAVDTNVTVPTYSAERLLTDKSSGTYPRLLRLADGNILAAFTRVDGTTRTLVISLGDANGQNFVDLSSVDSGARDIDNVSLLELVPASGGGPNVLLAAFRNHDLDANGNYTWFRLTLCRSLDGGRSWSFVTQINEKSAPYGLWEPYLRLSATGAVQVFYAEEFASNDQDIMRQISSDGGNTWSPAVAVAGGNVTARYGMPGVAATQDGNRAALALVFESNDAGPFGVHSCLSYDDGLSWAHPTPLFTPPAPHNAGAPQIASVQNQTLIAVMMSDVNATTVNWVQNAAIVVSFAEAPRAGVLQWSTPVTVSAASSYWPGVAWTDLHKVMLSYDRGYVPRAQQITMPPAP